MTNIVYITGGHGSGKSTLVRRFLCENKNIRVESGYKIQDKFVVGSYENERYGGSDTIRPLNRLVNILSNELLLQNTVILEGIGQAGMARELETMMKVGFSITVLLLTTPVEECVAGVQARGHTLSEEGVRRGWVRAQNGAVRLNRAGATLYRVTRRTAYSKLKEVLA